MTTQELSATNPYSTTLAELLQLLGFQYNAFILNTLSLSISIVHDLI